MIDPFAEFRVEETASTNEAFRKLAELIQQMQTAELKVIAAEAALKAAQEEHRALKEGLLPEHMESLGLQEFTTTDGAQVEVRKEVRASIGNRKEKAYEWLIKNGHGGLIKRTVEIAFNRDQAEKAEALLKEQTAKDDNAGVRMQMKVEAASLTAWAKKQLAAGVDIPHDLFGIFEQKFAEIKKKSSE